MDIISARAAFDLGKTRYFSGSPCKLGHIAERMISNGCCCDCMKERRNRNREKNYQYVKAWRMANPGKLAEQSKRYTEKHPETAKKAKEKYRESNIVNIRESDKLLKRRLRVSNPEAEKRRLKEFYGRKEQKRELEAGRPRPQVCDVCNGKTDTSCHDKIVYDHCHLTGKFRGWICDRCNKTLGMVQDSPDLLLNLALYLENFNGKVNIESQESAADRSICGSGQVISRE
jgi:hypothetical protein